MSSIQLEKSWSEKLKGEFTKPYMLKLRSFIDSEKKLGKIIYPRTSKIFEAFNQTPFSRVKVVVIGQDPYHGEDQAHGLAFSVNPRIKIPPSLQNIYKELTSDLALAQPSDGHLLKWAQEGVLLLNAILTVEKSKPCGHQNRGWEIFTDKVVLILNEEKEGLVFILWGGHAQKKGADINTKKHLVIKSSHPSPLSSYRGFFGSRPFSKANSYLIAGGNKPIDWGL